MTFDEYSKAIRAINEQLESITKMTANQAFLGIAEPDNPQFVALMRKHAELTKKSHELSQIMLANLGIKD